MKTKSFLKSIDKVTRATEAKSSPARTILLKFYSGDFSEVSSKAEFFSAAIEFSINSMYC